MKIYTKTGDKGMTGLYTGQRIPKDSLRVTAYGTVDEVNSALGLARSLCKNVKVRQTVYDLQKLLWSIMAELASLGSNTNIIDADHVQKIEKTIDEFDAELPKLNHFIIPGEEAGSAALDLARTTARRAERTVLTLSREEPVNEHLLILLNRLSDLCFILSRAESELK